MSEIQYVWDTPYEGPEDVVRVTYVDDDETEYAVQLEEGASVILPDFTRVTLLPHGVLSVTPLHRGEEASYFTIRDFPKGRTFLVGPFLSEWSYRVFAEAGQWYWSALRGVAEESYESLRSDGTRRIPDGERMECPHGYLSLEEAHYEAWRHLCTDLDGLTLLSLWKEDRFGGEADYSELGKRILEFLSPDEPPVRARQSRHLFELDEAATYWDELLQSLEKEASMWPTAAASLPGEKCPAPKRFRMQEPGADGRRFLEFVRFGSSQWRWAWEVNGRWWTLSGQETGTRFHELDGRPSNGVYHPHRDRWFSHLSEVVQSARAFCESIPEAARTILAQTLLDVPVRK